MGYEPKHGRPLVPGTPEYQAALDKLLQLAGSLTA